MTDNKTKANRIFIFAKKRVKNLFVMVLICVVLLSVLVSCEWANIYTTATPHSSEQTDFFTNGRQRVLLKSVYDGDTAWFIMGNKEYKTRFIGIDTPEMGNGKKEVEDFAKEATLYTKQKLEQADVIELERDCESDTFDRYDRLIAWVWVDGELLNEKLVEKGLATVRYIYGDYKYLERLYLAQDMAQCAGRGVWGE